MEFLWESLLSITWQQLVMYVVGGLLIWLAIEKGFEPALLLPMGFGAILVNLPTSGVINQVTAGVGETHGIIQWLFEVGISASEAMPILLFIGIGAMIDFGPLLANPKLFLCGAAAQAGIFLTILLAAALAPPPSWSPRCSTPTMWEPSRWLPTPIWPWYPSSSPLPSSW